MKNILIIASLFMGFVEAHSQGMFNVKFGRNLVKNIDNHGSVPFNKHELAYDFEGGYKLGPIEVYGNYSHDYSHEGVDYVVEWDNNANIFYPTFVGTTLTNQSLTSLTLGLRYVFPDVYGVKPFISNSIGEATFNDIQFSDFKDNQTHKDKYKNQWDKRSALTMKNSVGFRYFCTEGVFIQTQIDYMYFFENTPRNVLKDSEIVSARIGIGSQF
jgi:hypothetical protein